jgi:hypothetical protein
MPEQFKDGDASPVFQSLKREKVGSLRIDPSEKQRPPVTPETKEILDKKLVALGKLMEGSGIWWQLDGSLNISLNKGEYIGVHGDVDMSVLRPDAEKFESHLAGRGYGLFLAQRDKSGDYRTFKRVAARNFKVSDEWQLRVMKVDELGKIADTPSQADLISVDAYVIDLNDRGEPITSISGSATFPKEWLAGKTIDFEGAEINLSHPARFIFHKIRSKREYDEGDIDEFLRLRLLSKEDAETLERIMSPLIQEAEAGGKIDQEYASLIRRRLTKLRTSVST